MEQLSLKPAPIRDAATVDGGLTHRVTTSPFVNSLCVCLSLTSICLKALPGPKGLLQALRRRRDKAEKPCLCIWRSMYLLCTLSCELPLGVYVQMREALTALPRQVAPWGRPALSRPQFPCSTAVSWDLCSSKIPSSRLL